MNTFESKVNQLMTEKITLRPWEHTDLDDLVKYANNPNIAGNMTNGFPHPYTEEHGQHFIVMAQSHQPTHIFAICLNNKAIGGIGVHPQHDIHEKCAELGYWLAEPYWGKGYVTQAVEELIDYAFAKFDIVRLYARPFSSNVGSQKVLEKCGFKHEATLKKSIYKNGLYLDEWIYSMIKD